MNQCILYKGFNRDWAWIYSSSGSRSKSWDGSRSRSGAKSGPLFWSGGGSRCGLKYHSDSRTWDRVWAWDEPNTCDFFDFAYSKKFS